MLLWTPYIGETSRSINQRIREHADDIKHGKTCSSSLAGHADKYKHHIFIEEAQVVARVSHSHHRKLREALEIEKRPNNLNIDDGWIISRSLVPILVYIYIYILLVFIFVLFYLFSINYFYSILFPLLFFI